MNLSDTITGGEYWFVGGRGPYRTKAQALAGLRGMGSLKDYERDLLLAVRVNPACLEPGPLSIQYGSGEAFQVVASYPLDEFGRLEVAP